ncbi:ABC transporter ATP-binding protein [Streptococcus catagoni]|uniref:ABC transporter ATP-binding protein n=1 Tax=Streptococcus catagoni TaxID=2654874 RepID=UPI00140D78BE|nr:ABC transporter ATP-binding protein [Streptococcus catagoni]
MSTISADHIGVTYGKESIINDLSLELHRHKITTIIGANGCGKSTLLKALTRIIPISKGSILIDGHAISSMPTKAIAKKMALLPQVQEVTDGISVYQLVSYGRYPHQRQLGRLTEKDKEIIEWALQVTHTSSLSKHAVDSLSGGQRQRVWIAMALAQDTDTIFLDEPTTYLDMNHQLEILQLLSELNKTSQKTIVMVLHDLNLSSRFSDRLIAMKEGCITYEGSVKEVMTADMIKETFNIDAQLIEDPIHKCPIILSYQLI